MITTQFSLSQFAGGGIELTLLERGGYRACDNAHAPRSLQAQEQLMEVMKVGERALELLGGPPSDPDAPNAKTGMVLRFMTHLAVDTEADRFVPAPTSELVTAIRQPAHRTTVVSRRAVTSSGVSEQSKQLTYNKADAQEYLIKPLRDNILLASHFYTVADPIRQLQELQKRVAKLEAEAAEPRTIFTLGGLSLSVQRRAQQ